MKSMTESIIKAKLCPYPKNFVLKDDVLFLKNSTNIFVNTKNICLDKDKKKIKNLFNLYWEINPVLNFSVNDNLIFNNKEEYKIDINQEGIEISSIDISGIYIALKTLRQLAEPERNVKETNLVFFNHCTIEDSPKFNFRALHLCYFPETDILLIEKAIRLASYYKFNHIVLEFWGIFPFESHPEISFKGFISKKQIQKIVDLGKNLNITFIPMFNLLGHASGSRIISGKHSTLDFHPKLAPLFEPGGWSWCLSNPETTKLQTDVVNELCDLFSESEYFHIGFDEAYDIGTCLECREKSIKELVKNKILYFHDLLAKKNKKIMMWHDMLLRKDDLRWKDFQANALPHYQTEELLDELPKDIVLIDWEYGYKIKNKSDFNNEWPTLAYLKSKGFPIVAAPWDWEQNIISFGEYAIKQDIFGIMATSWQSLEQNMEHIFYYNSQIAWGTDGIWKDNNYKKDKEYFSHARIAFNKHLREVVQDMKISKYEYTGKIRKKI